MNNKNSIETDYYKAYEKRYSQVHSRNMLWATSKYTPDVANFFKNCNIKKSDKVLDLGCGEGRDAINLLNKGYNLLAVDYSKAAIEICNKLTNNKYKKHFVQFDLISDMMNEQFDYIYSIAVLHMFVTKEHRNNFLSFVKNHLKENGKCLICVMGNGHDEFTSDINDAFKVTKRKVINTGKEVEVVGTSCRIVNWINFEREIKENGLEIDKKWISKDIPEFSESMCVVVKNK